MKRLILFFFLGGMFNVCNPSVIYSYSYSSIAGSPLGGALLWMDGCSLFFFLGFVHIVHDIFAWLASESSTFFTPIGDLTLLWYYMYRLVYCIMFSLCTSFGFAQYKSIGTMVSGNAARGQNEKL